MKHDEKCTAACGNRSRREAGERAGDGGDAGWGQGVRGGDLRWRDDLVWAEEEEEGYGEEVRVMGKKRESDVRGRVMRQRL